MAIDIAALAKLEERVLWLSSQIIHNANHIRPNRDGLKVGGHQASCASIVSLMCALYFSQLRPNDRVAVKPHASPIFHAIQFILGNQTLRQLQDFRAFGGAQSYPSRTKDKDDVDFSTGSVGLGVAISAFASLTQDYLAAREPRIAQNKGRMISLLGDGELDEGNIYEALIESYKHDLRNIWWIVDYNRQSLDATTSEKMWDRFDDIFETTGFEVINLKYGKLQRAIFSKAGGLEIRDWIDNCNNDLYAALSYQGGGAWREALNADLSPNAQNLISELNDEELSRLMTQLGGHCLETIVEAFENAKNDDKPKLFIAYTVKGWRLPFQGHKDNHSGLMTQAQFDAFRASMGVPIGYEWNPFAGLSADEKSRIEKLLSKCEFAKEKNRRFKAPLIDIPNIFEAPIDAEISTQMAFGKILGEIAKEKTNFASRIVTTSPDVTVSTNLGGFVNRRGVFSRAAQSDVFKDRKIPSPQTWAMAEMGQHIELGIAENNLFLNLAALGLSAELFGERLFPIGTLYDPFIARGLDALNYAIYQGAKFILVSTPSGITLGPEGGAHQSINTPLIGMGQPGLTYYEPAYADELALLLNKSFHDLQSENGECSYFRLSTRPQSQLNRANDKWQDGTLKGGYWYRQPLDNAKLIIAYCGAIAPEALDAFEQLKDDFEGIGLLAITSPDLLHRDWQNSGRSRFTKGQKQISHIETLFENLAADCKIISIIDGSPNTLSWLGAVCGMKQRALGVEQFGQVGDLIDLYAHYRLNAAAIIDAAADLFLDV